MDDDTRMAMSAARGDETAFLSLLDRHYDRVFRLAFRLTGHQIEAEDLTQDICAALPAKLSAFAGEARFSTWLYRVVVNAAHDRRRRQATRWRAADGWGLWECGRQAEAAEARARSDWLAEAMCHLGQDLRETLVLVLEGVTHAEAAEVLGVSEGTVSWRMSEARKKLRSMREEEEQ